MKKILITGGPVYAYLDDVKIITSNFKGGRMAWIAESFFNYPVKVIYLCKKGSIEPTTKSSLIDLKYKCVVTYHDGFDDYEKKVLEYAHTCDAVILGAAVANLIPYQRIEGKFPSHRHKPGDLIPLIFKVAPRVIDQVKKINPKTHLFGFKLLPDVPHEKLIESAYEILLSSRATTIFANDWKDLSKKYAVTKDRGIHPMTQEDIAPWVMANLEDEYYSTQYENADLFPT